MLLFRVGDFYETFGDDAVDCARILNITLTKRGAGSTTETALVVFHTTPSTRTRPNS